MLPARDICVSFSSLQLILDTYNLAPKQERSRDNDESALVACDMLHSIAERPEQLRWPVRG
eukprot:6194918-Pleurochrysis_carterae.AAC.2